MHHRPLNIVILGLSITSSWGNGHATIFRALVRQLHRRGHHVTFLEREQPWYAQHRDLPHPPHGKTILYHDPDQLRIHHTPLIQQADLVIVGSYVPDGIAIGRWVTQQARGITAFYDIDTPITLAHLQANQPTYIDHALIRQYQLYLSFTGGPILQTLHHRYHAPRPRPFYCCADPNAYRPRHRPPRWDLGYMGTYSDDRMPALRSLLLEPASQSPDQRMLIAGARYPDTRHWPANVQHREHLPPNEHESFYNAQRFTLNITRSDMVQWGHAPSVRLFEAAACATPLISDHWPGLETFFEPDREILIAESTDDVLRYLHDVSAERARAIGQAARLRLLSNHTANHRAAELERYVQQVRDELSPAYASCSAR